MTEKTIHICSTELEDVKREIDRVLDKEPSTFDYIRHGFVNGDKELKYDITNKLLDIDTDIERNWSLPGWFEDGIEQYKHVIALNPEDSIFPARFAVLCCLFYDKDVIISHKNLWTIQSVFNEIERIWNNSAKLRELCDSKSGIRHDIDRYKIELNGNWIHAQTIGASIANEKPNLAKNYKEMIKGLNPDITVPKKLVKIICDEKQIAVVIS